MTWTPTSAVGYAAPLRAVDRWKLAEPQGASTELVATVVVDPQDPNLRGHFPGFPIYPGVFIVETLCQVMGEAFARNGLRPVLREVKSLRLTSPLEGGDELTMTVTVTPQEQGWRVQAKGVRRDGLAAATVTALFDRAVG